MIENTSNSTTQLETGELSGEALRDAMNIVLARINKRRVELEKCAAGDIDDMIAVVRGQTTEDWEAQVNINADILAQIMLDYRYYVFEVLGLSAPKDMLSKLAFRTGLGNVEEVWLEEC